MITFSVTIALNVGLSDLYILVCHTPGLRLAKLASDLGYDIKSLSGIRIDSLHGLKGQNATAQVEGELCEP